MSDVRVDYDKLGRGYADHRRADPHIASEIAAALGGAGSVVNVGAGAGSYEPEDRWVVAVEPSATIRAERPVSAGPVLAAVAEALPFADGTFDAAMACVTIHHWQPAAAGLAEMRRVARGRVVVFTFDLDCLPDWQLDYLGEALALERPRFPAPEAVASMLGGRTSIERVRTPGDCTDGFFEAFWRRPERLLDPAVRSAQSIWALVPPGAEQRIIDRLSADLASGLWDRHHGHLRQQSSLEGSLRLIISQPG